MVHLSFLGVIQRYLLIIVQERVNLISLSVRLHRPPCVEVSPPLQDLIFSLSQVKARPDTFFWRRLHDYVRPTPSELQLKLVSLPR